MLKTENFYYAERYSTFNSQERMRRGIIKNTMYHMAPLVISHERNLAANSLNYNLLKLEAESYALYNKQQSLERLDAKALKDEQIIAVFSKRNVATIQKLVSKNNSTPKEILDAIQDLNIDLPTALNMHNLEQLVDALQLMSLERAKSLAKAKIDDLTHRRNSVTHHFDAQTKTSDENPSLNNPTPSYKPKL